jgi:hypothetical protein
MHHIFLVEKRHTQRLKQESPLMEQIGVARHNVNELFSFGRSVRGEFMEFIHSAGERDLDRTLKIHYRGHGSHVHRAQARVPYAPPRDPSLGTDRHRRTERRVSAAWLPRPAFQ